jgi:hypothetical protein
MLPAQKLGASLPALTPVTYMGDTVYGFDISSRYHGYTSDQQMWHVYDENTNAYTSYTTDEFLNFLDNLGTDYTSVQNINNSGQSSGNFSINNLPVSTTDQFSWVKIGLTAGVALLGILFIKYF